MYRLCAASVLLSRGTPFFLAGEEMLRSKGGDSNSYASSDEVNNIDWGVLSPDSAEMAMVDYYKALIAMRRANAFLTGSDVKAELLEGGEIRATYFYHGKEIAYAVINPNDSPLEYTLPDGTFTLLMLGDEVYPEGGETVSGAVSVPAMGILLVRR